MQKLLDFSNMKEINYKNLEAYHRHHNIFFTVDGQKNGAERSVFTNQSKNIFSFEEIDLPLFLSPSPENEKTMSMLLKTSQQEYCDFLDTCITGKPDVIFINDRIGQFSANDLKFDHVGSFKFVFDIQFAPRNLEQHLDIFEIIYPIWRGHGETFARVKKCKNCSRYFYAVSLKAEFCQRKCRNTFNYHKNK